MNKKNSYDVKLSQNIDLNLYCLWLYIQQFSKSNYSIELKRKLYELTITIEEKLFKTYPENYNLVKEDCVLTWYFKKSTKPDN